jgi:hypothetical protein
MEFNKEEVYDSLAECINHTKIVIFYQNVREHRCVIEYRASVYKSQPNYYVMIYDKDNNLVVNHRYVDLIEAVEYLDSYIN